MLEGRAPTMLEGELVQLQRGRTRWCRAYGKAALYINTWGVDKNY